MTNSSVDKLFENLLQEKDTIAKAQLISILHTDREISLKEIASKLKTHPSYISHYLRIIQLPSIVLDGYYAKHISSAHLFILSRLKNEETIIRAYKEILAKNLNTSQAEELIRELKFTITTTNKMLGKVRMEEIIKDIKDQFPGVEVKLVQSRIKGKLVLEFKGDTEETSAFLKKAGERLSQKTSFPDVFDDTLQVIE